MVLTCGDVEIISDELTFTEPVCGSTLTSASQSFVYEWNSAPPGTEYGWWFGSAPLTFDYGSNSTQTTTGQAFIPQNLPNDGSTIYATIFYAPGGDWSGFDANNPGAWTYKLECTFTASSSVITTTSFHNDIGTPLTDFSGYTELDPIATYEFDGQTNQVLLDKVYGFPTGTPRKYIIVKNTIDCEINDLYVCGPDSWFPRQESQDGVNEAVGPVILYLQNNTRLRINRINVLGGNRALQIIQDKNTVMTDYITGMSIHNSMNSYRADHDNANGCEFYNGYHYTEWPLAPAYAGRGTDNQNWFEPQYNPGDNGHIVNNLLVEGNGPNAYGVGLIIDGKTSNTNTGGVTASNVLAMDNINTGMAILEGHDNIFRDSKVFQGRNSPFLNLSLSNNMLAMYDTRSGGSAKQTNWGQPANEMRNIEGEFWTDNGSTTAKRCTIDCTGGDTLYCWGHPSSRRIWTNIDCDAELTRADCRNQKKAELASVPCFPFDEAGAKTPHTHWIAPYV